jgi:hypothetical protein
VKVVWKKYTERIHTTEQSPGGWNGAPSLKLDRLNTPFGPTSLRQPNSHHTRPFRCKVFGVHRPLEMSTSNSLPTDLI